ncbi:hypothetical protein [Pedobacter paludis]|uniref:Uncharacterized protein n=1 Tax=Pedobacter paludis TaxID=2203212 RepID=A0A317EVU7_9SPHI|nr:hypothetical protein [Pedobacter paludis]PWS29869.1 hypothetical protein DF947_19980 [Pedobacter paludis]
MTFYERYINGQTEQVYQDIYALGQDAFLPTNLPDIEKVLTETFQRVAYNLDIIYSELKKINYLFNTECEYDFQRPLVKPSENTAQLLVKLENVVKPFGFIPLSLKMFYKIVGACNFGWDYDTNEEYLWQYADPIQIFSLSDVLSEVEDENFLSYMQESFEEEGFASLELSADYFHKDNTSGGPAYALKITDKPSVDGEFLNEEHKTTFINYLRICFDNCGFSRITNPENNNDYQTFFDKVKPQLRPI